MRIKNEGYVARVLQESGFSLPPEFDIADTRLQKHLSEVKVQQLHAENEEHQHAIAVVRTVGEELSKSAGGDMVEAPKVTDDTIRRQLSMAEKWGAFARENLFKIVAVEDRFAEAVKKVEEQISYHAEKIETEQTNSGGRERVIYEKLRVMEQNAFNRDRRSKKIFFGLGAVQILALLVLLLLFFGGRSHAQGGLKLEVQDEGTTVHNQGAGLFKLNFTGAGVSCAYDAINTRTNCTISGGGAGGGITTLNTLTADPQTFSRTNDTNVTLTITSTTADHNFALGWTGTLAKARTLAATVYTDQANTFGNFIQTFQAGNNFVLLDPTVTTRVAKFDLSNIAGGNTRTVNIPDANSTTVQANTGAANEFLTSISTQGVVARTQPSFSNLSGTATNGQLPGTFTGKTVDNSNTVTLKDTLFTLQDDGDATKQAQFELSNIGAGATRSVNVPNANSTTVQANTGAANEFLTAISAQGVVSRAQPSVSNLSDGSNVVKNNQANTYSGGGLQDFGAQLLELPNSTAPTGTDCDATGEAGRIHIDTNATSGQQVYVCEGLAGWVLQGDGGGGAGGYSTIEDEGVALTQRTTLNFTGAGSTCADSGGKTVCTVTSGGGDLTSTPGSAQTIQPTADATGLIVKQFNGTNTADTFSVQDKNANKIIQVESDNDVNIGSTSTAAGQVDLMEAAANGTDFAGFIAPDSVTTSYRLKLPGAIGTAGFLRAGATSSTVSDVTAVGETGSDSVVRATSPTITTPTITSPSITGPLRLDSTADLPRLYGGGSVRGMIIFGSQDGTGTSGLIRFRNNPTDDRQRGYIDPDTGNAVFRMLNSGIRMSDNYSGADGAARATSACNDGGTNSFVIAPFAEDPTGTFGSVPQGCLIQDMRNTGSGRLNYRIGPPGGGTPHNIFTFAADTSVTSMGGRMYIWKEVRPMPDQNGYPLGNDLNEKAAGAGDQRLGVTADVQTTSNNITADTVTTITVQSTANWKDTVPIFIGMGTSTEQSLAGIGTCGTPALGQWCKVSATQIQLRTTNAYTCNVTACPLVQRGQMILDAMQIAISTGYHVDSSGQTGVVDNTDRPLDIVDKNLNRVMRWPNSTAATYPNGMVQVTQPIQGVTKRLRADVASTSTTVADVTALTWPVLVGEYSLTCHMSVTSAATTTGVRISVNGPTSSNTDIRYDQYGIATSDITLNRTFATAYDTFGSNPNAQFSTNQVGYDIFGSFTFTASGTLAIRIKTEIAASAVTLKDGSFCTLL